MDTAFIQQVALPIVYVVVGIVLVWALVELILFLRNTRKTVSTLEEEIRPVISDVKEMTESLKPAVDKMDPLAERVSLAVDAANLEIMRLDGILENVDAMTTSAAGAANAVETVANTPMKLVNTAAEKLRGAFSQKKASDASVALGSAAEEAQAAALGEASAAASFRSNRSLTCPSMISTSATSSAISWRLLWPRRFLESSLVSSAISSMQMMSWCSLP